MNKRPGLLTLAYGLFGLLLISVLLITFARKTGDTEPSTGSFGPSGLTLLSGLLREEGYRVEATRDPTPFLDPKRDVPVAIVLNGAAAPFGGGEKSPDLAKQLEAFAKQGGTIVEARIGKDFGAITRTLRATSLIAPYASASPTVGYDPTFALEPTWVEEEPKTTPIWATPGSTPYVSLTAVEKGSGVFFSDFAAATNRFIDQNDNAAVIVGTFTATVPQGKRLVFLEAAWGNASEPGLFASIGDWAATAWNQVILLGLVILYTLGRPFGLPDLRRPGQKGQRDLVNAYGGLLRRAGATDIAMQAIAVDSDRRLRKALKIESGLDRSERDKLLPPELVELLHQAERASDMRVPNDVAANLANRLDAAVSEFAGDRRFQSRRRRKS